MSTLKTIITSVVVAAIVAYGVVAFVGQQAVQTGQTFGVQVQNDLWWFTGGVNAGNNGVTIFDSVGVITGLSGGSTHSTYNITTSTAFTAKLGQCQYTTFTEPTSTAQIQVTLPTATVMDSCLTQDGVSIETFFQLQAGNAYGITLATSTGDVIAYSTASNAMTTSTVGTYYTLHAWRMNSSSIVYTLVFNGNAH